MFKILKDIMLHKSVSKGELGRMIRRSEPYIRERLNGVKPFTLDDVYAISDVLGIAPQNIPLVFHDRRKYKPADVSSLLTIAGGDPE